MLEYRVFFMYYLKISALAWDETLIGLSITQSQRSKGAMTFCCGAL